MTRQQQRSRGHSLVESTMLSGHPSAKCQEEIQRKRPPVCRADRTCRKLHAQSRIGCACSYTGGVPVCSALHPFDSRYSQLHCTGLVLYTCHLCSGTCTEDQKTTTNIAAFPILLTGSPASRSCSWRPCMRLQHDSRIVSKHAMVA